MAPRAHRPRWPRSATRLDGHRRLGRGRSSATCSNGPTRPASRSSQLYFTVGMFAVAAGVLLLVNVFVMLADERRSELGMLRAMGMRRRPLVGALATRAGCYAVPASVLGRRPRDRRSAG